MESSFHGQLADKSTSNLIREIAEGHLSGLLRFYREEAVKAIFFEEGAPVFAASNLPAEQLEHKLLKNGLVDPDLIEEARRRSLTPEGLGWALVEVGAISQLSMDWSIHELATEIILSVFEWETGTYMFYEESGLDLGTRLDWPPAECVLAGSRRASRNPSIASAGAPPHRLVTPTTLGSPSTFGGLSTLNSVEGFVLSSVMTPTQIGDISSLTGLPESDARSAVYVLLALGLLQLEDEETADTEIASETPIINETPVANGLLGSDALIDDEPRLAVESMIDESHIASETMFNDESQIGSEELIDREEQHARETHLAGESQLANETGPADEPRIAAEELIAGESVVESETQFAGETKIAGDSQAGAEELIASESVVPSETQFAEETKIANETQVAAESLIDIEATRPDETGVDAQAQVDSENLIPSDSQIAGGTEVAAESHFAAEELVAGQTQSDGESQMSDATQVAAESEAAAETQIAGEDLVDIESLIDMETLTPSDSQIDSGSQITSDSQSASDAQIASDTQIDNDAQIASDTQIASDSLVAGQSQIDNDSQADSQSQIASEVPFAPATPPPLGRQESLLPGFDSGRYGAASLEWVLDVVGRKLTFMESASYYEQLGVERIAPTSRITDAYRQNSERLDSFKSRWPENQELCRQVDTLLAKMELAYATLSDPEKRSNYDRPKNATSIAPKRTSTVKPPAAVPKTPPVSDSKKPVVPLSGTGFDVALSPRSDVARVRAGQVFDPIAMAEQQYNRGRQHFDRRDFHSAVHLFREAAKLDASQSRYHFYLGVTLSVLSQARQTHKEHTHDRGCHVTCTLGGGLIRNQRIRREAEQHMLRAAELDRLNAEVRLRLALLYKDAGMEKKAQHYFLETLMLDANNLIAQRELGMETRSLPY